MARARKQSNTIRPWIRALGIVVGVPWVLLFLVLFVQEWANREEHWSILGLLFGASFLLPSITAEVRARRERRAS